MDSQAYFKAAINGCFLSDNPADDDYAGNYMFMGPAVTPELVVFKHIDTRESFTMSAELD